MCINPTIRAKSEDIVQSTEGCLSHPGLQVTVPRHRTIGVSYYDETGVFRMETLTDAESIIFQHEVDHLNGITLINKLA